MEKGKLTLVPYHPFQSHVAQWMDHGIPEDRVCYRSSHRRQWNKPEIRKMTKATRSQDSQPTHVHLDNSQVKTAQRNPVHCMSLENMGTILEFYLQALLSQFCVSPQ